MKRQIIGVALASSILLSGGLGVTNQVYADSIPVESMEEMNQYINEIDFLYVIDKNEYDKMMEKGVALFSIKDHLLVIDAENITEEEEAKLNTSKEFFIVGDLHHKLKDLKKRDNFTAEVLGKNRSLESVKYANKYSKNKDIVIANSKSLADSLTALQISKLENKSLILIDDKLSGKTKKYIKENGKNHQISFIEGEKSISEKAKRQIMKLARNATYEVNKENFIKSGLIPIPTNEDTKKVSKNVEIPTNIPVNIPTKNMELPLGNEISNENVFKGLNSTMSATIRKAANKSIEGSKTNFVGKEKTISIELDESGKMKTKSVSDTINSESVEVVKDNEKKTKEILKTKKKEGVSVSQISITNSKPVTKNKISKLKKQKKDYYIVPKKINEELIQKIQDGEYGYGPERSKLLTLEGYNYKKVQAELDRIEEERKQKAKEKRERKAAIKKEREAREQAALARQVAERSSDNDYYVANGNNTVSYNSTLTNVGKPSNNISDSSDVGSDKVENFIDSLKEMQGWTYSQPARMQYGYADCSSIIIRAMWDAGITSNKANMTTRSIAGDSRFYEIPFSEARRGDVLWTDGHVEIYMGGNTTYGAFRPGIPAGYSTGKNRFYKAFRINGL